MRITHGLAKPLPGKISILVGTGILVLGLLALSVLLSFSRTSHVVLASSNALHPFTITSPDFRDGGPLPQKTEFNQFGCTGSNIAPQLNWTNVPAGTQSFAMLMSDYDAPVAGGFHHWIVYNIPASARQLEGNHAFTEGTNSYGFIGYGGPCPPIGRHRYFFKLYALDTVLPDLGASADKPKLEAAMKGHVVAEGQLVGTYEKTK